MEYKHNFSMISSNNDADFDNEFTRLSEYDGEMIAVSKGIYQCFLGSKTIKYRIGVEVMDSSEIPDNDEAEIYVSLFLVPAFTCLCKEKREAIMNSFGLDAAAYKSDPDIYFHDAIEYGMTVLLEHRSYEYDALDLDSREKVVTDVLGDIASTYSAITGMIGFWLDRCVNRIGETGWDWLRILCNGVSHSTILKGIMKKLEKTT